MERFPKCVEYTETNAITLNQRKVFDMILYIDSDFVEDESRRRPITGVAGKYICWGWSFLVLQDSAMRHIYVVICGGVI